MMCMCACHSANVEVRRQLSLFRLFLPLLFGFQDLNSGPQACVAITLLTGLSCLLYHFSAVVIRYPSKSNLREKMFILAYAFRGLTIHHGEGKLPNKTARWDNHSTSAVQKQREQEVVPDYDAPRPTPNGSLPWVRLHFLKVPSPSQILLGDLCSHTWDYAGHFMVKPQFCHRTFFFLLTIYFPSFHLCYLVFIWVSSLYSFLIHKKIISHCLECWYPTWFFMSWQP